MVIATDSEYVVEGIAKWVLKWHEQEWQTKPGKPVKNRYLWEGLLQLVNEHSYRSVLVCFMRIPRHDNEEADRFARGGAGLRYVYQLQSLRSKRDLKIRPGLSIVSAKLAKLTRRCAKL